MSAGVSDQRMKGQGNQVSNVSKDQHLESGGDEINEPTWRQQQPQQAYAPPISSTADPYNTGYYGTAGTAGIPYQAFGVGDGTWSTNGTDPIPYLRGYNPHDTYGMDGVFGPSNTQFSTAAFGQPASTFNYFHGNGDYSTWGQFGRTKQYDEYYRNDGVYVQDSIKSVEAGVHSLGISEQKHEKERIPEFREASLGSQPKKTTWASIASQPAKPTPPTSSSGIKKKGPGMPPPPIIPGKHNMDIGTWDVGKTPPVSQPPPPLPPVMTIHQPSPTPTLPPVIQQQPPTPRAAPQPAPPAAAWPPATVRHQAPPPPVPATVPTEQEIQHPVLEELQHKNQYNPAKFDLNAPNARFFVIKSYSEDDIHRSIKYEIWCSTEHGNKRLDTAFRERQRENGIIYLFFSVNGSGHFCGMAQMISSVDYNANSSVWAQDKWKGQFKVRWIYVKDVPNVQLRHIRLENNENKPVTNSRDTQEVPHPKGLQVLRIMHGYCHSTSIFDDFIHYEKKQEEEDSKKVQEVPPEPQDSGRGYRDYNREYRRDERDHRDLRDQRDRRDARDYRDGGRGERESRDHREFREYRDYRDNREHRDDRDQRDHHRDNREHYRPHHNKDRGDNMTRGRGSGGGRPRN